jgi:hypothetical protein
MFIRIYTKEGGGLYCFSVLNGINKRHPTLKSLLHNLAGSSPLV